MEVAREEGQKRIAKGDGIQWEKVGTNATNMTKNGFLSTIKTAQQTLRDKRAVLSIDAARTFARDQQELDIFEMMESGAPQIVSTDFKPNWGIAVRERIGRGPDVSPALEIHIAEAARKGHFIILPLKTLVMAAIMDGILVHVSERFRRDCVGST